MSWNGKAVGNTLPVIEYNKNGVRPPLFWCFNGEHEPTVMASELGPEQPVYSLRSMQAIVEHDQKHRYQQNLIQEYTEEILAIQPSGPFFFGGNCQGGGIVEGIARTIANKGHEVAHIFFLDYEPTDNLDIDVSLFFGRDSETLNPFNREENPDKRWQSLFPSVTWNIVPGNHGQYFTPMIAPHFTRELSARLEGAQKKQAAGNT